MAGRIFNPPGVRTYGDPRAVGLGYQTLSGADFSGAFASPEIGSGSFVGGSNYDNSVKTGMDIPAWVWFAGFAAIIWAMGGFRRG